MNLKQEYEHDLLMEKFTVLLVEAAEKGFDVRITPTPHWPPKMGYHSPQVEISLSRRIYNAALHNPC